ncbi:MAG: pyridoxamine 5'-phosphate oxidase family protein [Armatimonadetes bacterium]|nr:pyridoxamine 5'-phosphate oxidase family protein [Armatimonadota bacterium]
MKILHKESEILEYLKKESLGILATLEPNSENIRLRVMYYGIDDEFNCYLMSTKGSPKIKQVLSSSKVSFIIFTIEDPYDESWEIEIDGTAELLKKKKEINFSMEKLKGKNPFADVALESGIIEQFDFVKLIPEIVRFRVYREALNGNPPSILYFK